MSRPICSVPGKRSPLQVAAVVALALLWVTQAGAAVSYRNVGAAAEVNGTALTLERPEGTGEGDLMLAVVVANSMPFSCFTAPAGWTLARGDDILAGTTPRLGQAVFYKVAQAADVAAATQTYTWTWTTTAPCATRRAAGAILVFRGVDPVNPIDAANGLGVNANSSTITAPSVTVSTANPMLVGFFGQRRSGANITASAPMTNRISYPGSAGTNNGISFAVGSEATTLQPGQASGDRTATSNRSVPRLGQLVALRSATVPGPVAYYAMDEVWSGSAGDVIDSSGNNLNGTSSAGPNTTTANAKFCRSGSFASASQQFVNVPDSGLLDIANRVTITAWIRPTTIPAAGNLMTIASKDENYEFHVAGNGGAANPNGGRINWWWTDGAFQMFSADNSVPRDAWTHVALVYTQGAQEIYINGVPSASNWADPDRRLLTLNADPFQIASDQGFAGRYFQGLIDEVRIYPGALSAADVQAIFNETPICLPGSVAPFGFNCVESGQDFLAGRLYTRTVGQGFVLDVIALRDSDSDGVADAIEANFVQTASKDVTVELVDASAGGACNALPALAPAVSQTLTFLPADAGRKASAAMAVTRAYPNLRCRVIDNNQVPAVVGCSTDNFSVRPTNFTVTSTMNADAGGTSTSATPALNAGASFSVTATATAGYNGSPGINSALVGAHAGAVAVGALGGGFGSADPATGAVTGSGFAYSEVGYFRFQPYGVRDTTFTSVDQGAGDCVVGSYSNTVDGFGKVGCNFGNTANTNFFGRFVPDHFTLGGGSSVTPACASGFTYMGQPNLGVLFQVQARNTVNATTQNYNGGFAPGTLAMLAENADSGSDLSSRVAGVAGGWASGVFNVSTFPSEAQATFIRPGVTPDGPFDALRLGVRVGDPDGVLLQGLDMNPATAGNCVAAGNCTGKAIGAATTRVRFGRLRLVNAHGSELLELRVPFFAQYWNGGAFALNALDSCTSIPVASVTLANYQRNLNAGETVVKTPPASIPFTTGVGDLRLTAPGANNSGSVDLAVDLSTLPYLRGEWDAVDQGGDGNRYDDDPRARATFGIFKGSSEIIYQRENY